MDNNSNVAEDKSKLNSTDSPEQKRKKTILIILLVLIVIDVAGYFIYTKLIMDSGSETPSTDNNWEVYKTKNGNKTLKLSPQVDGKIIAKYNDVDLEMYSETKGDYNVYTSLNASDLGCSLYSFVINNKTKELLDLEYGNENTYYIANIGEVYYLLKGTCNVNRETYDLKLNKIADTFIETDGEKYFYALKDGYLNKYDINGKLLKNGNTKLGDNNDIKIYFSKIQKDNLYTLIIVNKELFLYDFLNDKKYVIDNSFNASGCQNPNGDTCISTASMDLIDNKILIYLTISSTESTNDPDQMIYMYDTESLTISKMGKYIASDLDLDGTHKGYIYVSNDDGIIKYDYKGNIIEKSNLNIKNVYHNNDSKYGVSSYFGFNGKLLCLIKEANKLYLQNAFTKEKYEIVDLDKYDLLTVRLYWENDTVGKFSNKIEIIVLDKNDTAKKNEIIYYFDVNKNTIENNN